MRARRVVTALAVAAGLGVTAAACSSSPPPPPNAQQQESNQQQADSNSMLQSQPIPHFGYSQIRQTLIDVETLTAQGTQTTTFFMNMGEADPVFVCPSIGMPVAANAELTNPQQQVADPNAWDSGSNVLGQMDPNGIYSSPSSQGTYVVCVNASGQPYLQYWEGNVLTAGAGAVWDYANHREVVNGAPTYKVTVKAGG